MMGLFPKTPLEAIFFLSGAIPSKAMVVMRMFTLLDMISRLGPGNYLFEIGIYSLHNQLASSWNFAAQTVAISYDLPLPLHILTNPYPKSKLSRIVKSKMVDSFHSSLCESAKRKSSLKFLQPQFLPISRGPHPLWLSCGSSRSAIRSAKIQAVILSGRYRDFKLLAKINNDSENCKLPGCVALVGDCEHLLSGDCPALQHSLHETLSSSLNLLSLSSPLLVPPVLLALSRGSFEWTKFLLNPSVDVEVLKLKQIYGENFVWPHLRLSRAYIWCMDKEKSRLSNASSTQLNNNCG